MNAKVLLVEDDKFTALTTTKRLSKRGHHVQVAPDGESALQKIKAEEFDVVLLDMVLPGISGFETLTQLRKVTSPAELPIIILTSLEEVDTMVQGLQKGANDYITKPANLEVMIARIETQTQLRRLHIDSVTNKELETLSAMTVTYHHELNNPLAIALGYLRMLKQKNPELEELQRIEKALTRMSDVVRKIGVTAQNPVETVPYSGGAGKLIKIHNE